MLVNPEGFSIEAMVLLPSSNQTTKRTIYSEHPIGSDLGFTLDVWGGYARLTVHNEDQTEYTLNELIPSQTAWVHITVSYYPGYPVVYMAIDGDVASKTIAGNRDLIPTDNGSWFNDVRHTSQGMNGSVQYVRIYDTFLDPDKLRDLYITGNDRGLKYSCSGSWDFRYLSTGPVDGTLVVPNEIEGGDDLTVTGITGTGLIL